MKKWFKSKTLWFNFLVGVAQLALDQIANAPMDANTIGTILAIGNALLRLITNKGIEGIPAQHD